VINGRIQELVDEALRWNLLHDGTAQNEAATANRRARRARIVWRTTPASR